MRYRASDFDYSLPAERIAQEPLPDRAASRLLVLDRASGSIRHARFPDLVDLVAPEDVLVLNASRVIPARLHGKRETGNVAELLLVRELPDGTWLAMGHPGGKLKPGRRVTFGDDSAVEIVEVLGGGLRRVKFAGQLDAAATLAKYGTVPLPPYIRRPPRPEDRERYQTVYAEHDGSVAAPTAGLHFTPQLLERFKRRGTALATLDLQIGPGTFKPVEVDDLANHPMHAEPYRVSDETADPAAGDTSLFIHPPYTFRAVDRLLTNFHLPRSTLLMLVCAFGGYERVMRAYGEAIEQRYRFYSYGDAMLVV